MSWWDYGYQIAGMANRTTLVDNNTWNNSHIALVGKAMSSNESRAYEIMTELNVDYVLVIFGGVMGYSGDDINKFLWMVRIAEGEHPNEIRESDYFTERGEFRVDSEGTPTLLNCLMYKLSYYRFGDLKLDYHTPAGFDRTRNAVIGHKDFELTYLEEAYTTEHWLVRIYRFAIYHAHWEKCFFTHYFMPKSRNLDFLASFDTLAFSSHATSQARQLMLLQIRRES